MKNENKLNISCDCNHSIIQFEYDELWHCYFVNIFKRTNWMSIIDRIKLFWQILIHGRFSSDDIIIDEDRIKQIIDFINKNNKKKLNEKKK